MSRSRCAVRPNDSDDFSGIDGLTVIAVPHAHG